MPFALAIIPFLTPAIFAAGAAATSIPIIIHLLNRRRFKTLIWAAMDFLLAAERRNSRRLRFQRWLLLILRILAILIIAAAIAQLTLSGTAVAILGGSDRGIVVIWDDSYAMGYHDAQQPAAFEKSRKLLADWITHLPSSDKVAVLRASAAPEPLVATPTLDHRSVEKAIQNTTLSDGAADLAGALDRAAGIVESMEQTTHQRQVILVTNCALGSIHPRGAGDGADASEAIKKSVEKVKKFAALRVVDMGQAKQYNMGITRLETARPVVVAGHSADFRLSIYNGFDTPQTDQPVSLLVDGVVVASEKLARIEPGAERDILLSQNIAAPGRHLIEARLTTPLDPLEIDDTRYLIANVVRELPVLIVDGSPGDQRTLGASTFLDRALAPVVDGKNLSVFAPRVITELELPRTPLDDYAAIVLTDTSAPDSPTSETLRKYVNDGGLLIFFPGNRTNTEAINRSIGDSGVKLLPATLGPQVRLETATQTGAGLRLDPLNYAHPVLELFGAAVRNNINPGLSTVQTTEYIKLSIPRDGAAETILKFTDGAPAVVLGRVGRGKSVLFATSSDTAWNTWGALPSYAPFMHELLYYGISRQADNLTLPVGGTIHLAADVAAPGNWSGPHNTTASVVTAVDNDKSNGRSFLISQPLRLAGVYSPTAGDPPVIAVNTDPSEVDVRHVPAAQMSAALGIDAKDILPQPKTLEAPMDAPDRDTNSDVGRNLIPIALALLVAETLLARLFSMYR
jgi:hypothetical protein